MPVPRAQVAQEAGGIAFVEDTKQTKPALQPVGQLPAIRSFVPGRQLVCAGTACIDAPPAQETGDRRIQAVAELFQLIGGQMHLGVMEFHLPRAGPDHHGGQHQAEVAQGLVHAGAHGPLLEQQDIELLPAPIQLRDGVGGGINPHQLAVSTLQPAGADLPNRGIPDQGSNREGWLSHGRAFSAGRPATVGAHIDERKPKAGRLLFVFQLACVRPNDEGMAPVSLTMPLSP